jgi:predicted DNA-binding helix-hairpin-helix protein
MGMDGFDTLKLLSQQMDLEPAEEAGCARLSRHEGDIALTDAVISGGKTIRLLKTLLTSACERNCYYCPFRAGRDFRRATFKPEELAQTFMSLHRAGLAQGIFLSSGIVGKGVRTQDKLIAAAEILRQKFGFTGYLHLKIMPGAEKAQVERSMQLADRVSINLEAPNAQRLEILAPRKQFFDELMAPLGWIEEIRRTQPDLLGWNQRWPSSVTQFVVGGAGESDVELLAVTEHLYRQYRLRRTYYSAFRPIPYTPLENLPAESQLRQQRLYQASFLLRDYGFNLKELPLDEKGNLLRHNDPKTAWAKANLVERPVEINRATRQELLHIPGIGPIGATRIIEERRKRHFHAMSELGVIGIDTLRVAPYILLDGKRPAYQKAFW